MNSSETSSPTLLPPFSHPSPTLLPPFSHPSFTLLLPFFYPSFTLLFPLPSFFFVSFLIFFIPTFFHPPFSSTPSSFSFSPPYLGNCRTSKLQSPPPSQQTRCLTTCFRWRWREETRWCMQTSTSASSRALVWCLAGWAGLWNWQAMASMCCSGISLPRAWATCNAVPTESPPPSSSSRHPPLPQTTSKATSSRLEPSLSSPKDPR